MKEGISKEDITILVRGFYYKIPWYVLVEDPDIRDMYDLYDENPSTGGTTAVEQLQFWIIKESQEDLSELTGIKGIVALKQEQYVAYRYVKLNEIDDPREAMETFVNQFKEEDDMTRLKRELSFFAGMEWQQFRKQNPFILFAEALIGVLGGRPEKILIEVPRTKFWPCSSYIKEIMDKHSIKDIDPLVQTNPENPQEGQTVRPVLVFNYYDIEIKIREVS